MFNSGPIYQGAISRILTISIFAPVQILVSQTREIRDVYSENESLKKSVIELTLKNADLETETLIIPNLDSILNFKQSFKYDIIASKVVARDPSMFFRTIVIDVGRSSGIRSYMPVVSTDGLVGKVITVAENSSLVQLLRSPDEYVSVMHKKSGEVAMLSFKNGKTLSSEFRKHVSVEVGDTVVTSGFGGIYPSSINVGTVEEVDKVSISLYNEVVIKPTVDFKQLRSLFVISLEPSWSAFRNEIDSLMEGN